MLVWGIETSCDETSASVVKDGRKVLSNVVFSSEAFHKKFGGVIPEIASRHHVEKINFVLEQSLKKAGINYSCIDLIAVTKGPGLVGSLLTGVTSAKWLGYVLNKPVMGVNHIKAHLFSSSLEGHELEFPALGIVVSGGHTFLIYVKNYLDFKLIGTTIDDAAGEAFDKVSKLLGLGYPGGRVIEENALTGNKNKIKFPIALKGRLDFSFSGLKTAVLYYLRDNVDKDIIKKEKIKEGSLNLDHLQDICASFQETVVETVKNKAKKALMKYPEINAIITGGGVFANNVLRNAISLLAADKKIKVFLPEKRFCTDNAAMVASYAYWKSKSIKRYSDNFEAVPDLNLESK